MSMLVDFLCRFAWGMALGLVLTPAGLVPGGFFRVNLLVVMGLTTFAALLAGGALPGGAWVPPAVAAVAAWIGTVAWLLGRAGPGLLACAAAALAAGMAVWNGSGGDAAAAARHLLSGAVVGLSVHAMLLGHWYLNAPGMSVSALRRMIDLALAAWGLMLLACALSVVRQGGILPAASQTSAALLWLRWLAGLVGLPVLLWMSRETLRIPNTQSATGILYVACLASIVGELSDLLLAAG